MLENEMMRMLEEKRKLLSEGEYGAVKQVAESRGFLDASAALVLAQPQCLELARKREEIDRLKALEKRRADGEKEAEQARVNLAKRKANQASERFALERRAKLFGLSLQSLRAHPPRRLAERQHAVKSRALAKRSSQSE